MTDKTMTFEERQAAEYAKRGESAKLVGSTAHEVARELGENWTAVAREDSWTIAPLSHRFDLIREDGLRFSFDGDSYKFDGKIDISGYYDFGPSHLGLGFPYGKTRPSIRVSVSRRGVAIAKDIKRRFLPEFAALTQEINDRVASHLKAYNEKSAVTNRLAEVAGAKVFTHEFRTVGGGIEGKVWNYPSLRIDMRFDGLTEEDAAMLIRLYKTLKLETEGS